MIKMIIRVKREKEKKRESKRDIVNSKEGENELEKMTMIAGDKERREREEKEKRERRERERRERKRV